MKKILLLIVISFTFLYGNCTRNNQKEVVECNDKYVGKLIWQDDSSVISVLKTYKEAKSYCANLTFGGYDDWRLPSIKELLSITDMSTYKPAIKGAFKNIKNNYYWSSTSVASDPSYAWDVLFKNGFDDWSPKSASYFVRCAR